MSASLKLAQSINEIADHLAHMIDMDHPNGLKACGDVHEAFIHLAEDTGRSLLEIVRDEPEMQIHWEERFTLEDYDRRPCLPDKIEDAANRLFETIQTAAATTTDITREKISRIIALELAALWYPRCDGFRELTGLTPTNFRPMQELPKTRRHAILLKDSRGNVRSTHVNAGSIEGITSETIGNYTWMHVPT